MAKSSSSDNPSKFMMDLNMRELDRFFHPEKFPAKAAVTASALAVIVFLFMSTTFPFKENLLNLFYQKEPSNAATTEAKLPKIYLEGKSDVSLSKEFSVRVMTNPNESIKSYNIKISYPQDKLVAQRIDSQGTFLESLNQAKIDPEKGEIILSGSGVKGDFKALKDDLPLAIVIFKSLYEGEAEIEISPDSQVLDYQGMNVLNTRQNLMLKIR